LLDKYPAWAKAFRNDDGPARLLDAALGVLVGFKLVHVVRDEVRPLPAAFRYTVSLAGRTDPDGGSATERREGPSADTPGEERE
jgi:hypothetical protein